MKHLHLCVIHLILSHLFLTTHTGLDQYWCWISPKFPGERLGGEYIWLWIALFASAILNIPLYFWAEGFWSIDEEYNFHWWDPDQRVRYPHRRAVLGMILYVITSRVVNFTHRRQSLASSYPVAYSLIVLPLTVARWLLFSGHHVSSAATFFAISMFYLSGTVNVLLFLITRPELLLFPRPEELDEQEDIPLAPQGTVPQGVGPANFSGSDMAKFQHSPEPASAMLGDGGSKDSATSSHVNPGQISEDIEV